jgi:hypothetical protein
MNKAITDMRSNEHMTLARWLLARWLLARFGPLSVL